MSLLIDGYNLLHAAGILGRGVGPGSLQRARLALLNFLAESLEPAGLPRTTVVFDARDAPPGLPRTLDHRGITVHFPPNPGDADAMIEELIRTDSAPRRLTVVSSDHRLQRAARRRKATAVDADVWYAAVVRQRRERRESTPAPSPRPPVPLLEEDVTYWLRQFGGESALKDLIEEELSRPTVETPQSPAEPPPRAPSEETSPDKPSPSETSAFNDIFPPGYAEDLLEEEGADERDSP